MDTDDAELINLEHGIEERRRAYLRARDHLRLMMKDAGADPEAADHLAASADEFGADHTVGRLAYEPSRYGLTPDSLLLEPARRARLRDVLEEVTDQNGRLGMEINAREAILCRRDPNRERRYNIDGRDAGLDRLRKTMRYLDDHTSEVLTLESVEPLGAPDRIPELHAELRLAKRRRRDRER